MRSLALLFIAATALQGQVTTPGIIAKPSASALTYGQSLSYSVLSGGSAGNDFVVTTLAGSTQGYQDGVAEVAQFKYPQGLAIDAEKNVYVADTHNNRIRKVTPSGVVTTVAGSGYFRWGEGYGEEAAFKNPSDLTVDSSGNLFISDTYNSRIALITPDRHVSTLQFKGTGAPWYATQFGASGTKAEPLGITTGPDGKVYYVGKNDPGSMVPDVNGIFRFSYAPRTMIPSYQLFAQSTNGPGGFENYGRYSYILQVYAVDLAVDNDGNMYVVTGKKNFNQAITKVTPWGTQTRLAGTDRYTALSPTNRFADGLGPEARFFCPSGITIDSSGNLYVADTFNHRIRKVTPAGLVTTIAGTGTAGFQDGPVATAKFNHPYGIEVDSSTNIYVADTYNQRIRKVTPANNVAGTWAWASPNQIPPAGTTSQTVIFSPQDNVNYNSFTSTVNVTVAKASSAIISSPTASAIYYGQALSNSALIGGSASVRGTFSWPNASTTPGLGISSHSVIFTPDDTANYNTATTTVSVTVNKATPSITSPPTASAITRGQTLASSTLIGGSASVAGTFAWTTSSTAPNVGTSGQSVTFTPTDTGNYNTTTTTVNVTVNKGTPTITTAPTAGKITYGQTLANSTLSGGSANVAGRFAWTTPSQAPQAGTQNLSVTFTPNDTANYNTATRSVSVTVNKATPVIITAPTATQIFYGQTLVSSTLSGGSASVAGRFAWTTPSTAPAVGTTVQDVTFTPTDTANYNTATTSVSVMVNPTITSDLSAVTITLGANYSYQITGSGSPTSFQATGLPKGLSLNRTSGQISGAPTQTGTFPVTLKALKSWETLATAVKVVNVVQVPTFTYAAKINAKKGKALKVVPKIAGYPAPTFSILSGSLPPGLSLNASTAAITGTPTTIGTYPFTVRGSNSAGNTDRSATIVVK